MTGLEHFALGTAFAVGVLLTLLGAIMVLLVGSTLITWRGIVRTRGGVSGAMHVSAGSVLVIAGWAAGLLAGIILIALSYY
jgi:hypothetical protein